MAGAWKYPPVAFFLLCNGNRNAKWDRRFRLSGLGPPHIWKGGGADEG
jgi:hypothetical protein